MVRSSSVVALSACLLGAALWSAGCGGHTTPTAATAAPSAGLSAPTPNAPADGAQLTQLRVTLAANNGASADASAPRTYEFQVSDRSDFAADQSGTSFAVAAHGTGIAEGSGTTSYTPDFDLQPATRFYWRVRIVQGSAASAWSATRSFNSAIAGYSRPGELYDPLVNGATVGVPVGSTAFVSDGIMLRDQNAYVRYQLATPLASGEISMEVLGLHAGAPGQKLKVFSMEDGTGDLIQSNYLLDAQYRGIGGNPDNCITWKALFGDSFLKIEPDVNVRTKAIMNLDPSQAYFWKGTWSDGFTLLVQQGIGGNTLFNYGLKVFDVVGIAAVYHPTPHFAYLGANTTPLNLEEGSFPGAIYRNVWIGAGPRPASLGSALAPR